MKRILLLIAAILSAAVPAYAQSSGDNWIPAIVLCLALVGILFIVLRMFWLWYFKLNQLDNLSKMAENQERIIRLLEKLNEKIEEKQ